MESIQPKDNCIDVICQHTRDGKIIPLRIRAITDDGTFQTYTIKSYKDVSPHSTSGIIVKSHEHQFNWIFDCRIQVFERILMIRIFYNTYDNRWHFSKML